MHMKKIHYTPTHTQGKTRSNLNDRCTPLKWRKKLWDSKFNDLLKLYVVVRTLRNNLLTMENELGQWEIIFNCFKFFIFLNCLGNWGRKF